jgi:hypothetical protein
MERERKHSGRWIAGVQGLPGVRAYGGSQRDALANMESLALRVLVSRLGHAETVPEVVGLFFGGAEPAPRAPRR